MIPPWAPGWYEWEGSGGGSESKKLNNGMYSCDAWCTHPNPRDRMIDHNPLRPSEHSLHHQPREALDGGDPEKTPLLGDNSTF